MARRDLRKHTMCLPARISWANDAKILPSGFGRRSPRPMPDTTITSRRHPLVARCRDAADGQADEVLLDGPHLVADAIAPVSPCHSSSSRKARDERPRDRRAASPRASRRARVVQRVTPAVHRRREPDAHAGRRSSALASLALHDVSRLVTPAPALVTVAVGSTGSGQPRHARAQQRGGWRHRVDCSGAHRPSVRLEGPARRHGQRASPADCTRRATRCTALQSLRAHDLRLVALSADARPRPPRRRPVRSARHHRRSRRRGPARGHPGSSPTCASRSRCMHPSSRSTSALPRASCSSRSRDSDATRRVGSRESGVGSRE